VPTTQKRDLISPKRPIALPSASRRYSPLAANETLIFRVALDGHKSVYRDIEIESGRSLYKFAEAIVAAFGFDFDHAFGFYSALTRAGYFKKFPKYELFADMGEADAGVQSVKKTTIAKAFPAVKHELLFLFDYGDEWLFRVTLRETSRKVSKTRYPRIVTQHGEAPEQYPDPEEFDDDEGPRFGFNPLTGEKFEIK
jgi:hypothetical protein